MRKHLNVLKRHCPAVNEKAALWAMVAGPSEGHQGTPCHPALRRAQDVPEVSQSPLSDRTQQVEHWRCSCVPIVLASGGMQASDVEAVDTAHHCSSQRPMPRTNVSMWNTLPIGKLSVSMPETVGGRPRCSTMSQRRMGYRHAVKDIGSVETITLEFCPHILARVHVFEGSIANVHLPSVISLLLI